MKVERQKQKTVLVTGGSGFVGKTLVPRLLDDGYQVVALARRSNIAAHLRQDNVRVEIGDMRDAAALKRAVKGVDYVVHAAATMSGSWDDFSDINVEGTRILLEAAHKAKVKQFVHISSVSVYAHADLKDEMQISENASYEEDEDASFYARSKRDAEKLVLDYHKEHNFPAVIFRPGAIYGPGGSVFPATMGLGLGEEKILMFGNSNTNLPLSYVENVADAVLQSFENENAIGEDFNLVEEESFTRKQYATRLQLEAIPELRVIHVPFWIMRFLQVSLKAAFSLLGRKAPLSQLNLKLYCTNIKYANDKFKEVFGSEPHVEFEESLQRTFAWHKQRRTPKRSHGLDGYNVRIPTDKKLNVGVIGCGYIAQVHLDFMRQIENVGRVVVADPVPEAAERIRKKFKAAAAYTDYTEMLDNEQLDVVHILTPPQYHSEIAQAAAKHGCHILVEKPMAVESREAREMVAAADKHSVKLCVMHNHLFDRVMLEAREILAKGMLGRITYVESWYGTQFGRFAPPFDPEKYWGYSLPGSLYQDYLPHALYVLLDVLESVEIRDVIANYVGGVPVVETDELKILFEQDKQTGILSLSLSTSPRYQFMNIYGTAGSLKIDFLHKVCHLEKDIGALPKSVNRILRASKYGKSLRRAARKNLFAMRRVQRHLYEGTEREIRLFYRSVLLDEPVPVPPNEGVRVMELMDQVWSKMGGQETAQQKLRA